MRGTLVAIRIEENAGVQQVTGLVGQPKNRKAAWVFRLQADERHKILEKVQECEAARLAVQEV